MFKLLKLLKNANLTMQSIIIHVKLRKIHFIARLYYLQTQKILIRIIICLFTILVVQMGCLIKRRIYEHHDENCGGKGSIGSSITYWVFFRITGHS